MCKPALAKSVKDIAPKCIRRSSSFEGKEAIILTVPAPKGFGGHIDISGCIGSGDSLRDAKASAIKNLRFLITSITKIDIITEY